MQTSNQDIATIVALSTLVFLLAPAFLLLYINSYNRRKKDHITEKQTLQQVYEADLLKTQLEVQEQTMKTIAADLHDNIGQLLSLTSLTLGSITVSDNKTAKKLDDSQQLVRRSIKELRQLANLLHGERIIENGLVDAINHEVDWLKKPGTYEVNFYNLIKEEYELSAEKTLIIFRLLQEVINNIIKHSGATEINISLGQAEGKILLSITDNGVGFQPDEVSNSGMGLSNLQIRTQAIQGELDIISAPDAGTTIAVKVPYP
ncbi:MAG: ATP-binding protein [Daejeonella sp.]|uniref:sensor histidine kinase n=1 Tax=Daejeonella sp. TaxID=2805397 RepID=UPI003C78B8AE